jgi:ribulose-5-phosphate 4-epimerase/fuculose-1-phosphate aldolase
MSEEIKREHIDEFIAGCRRIARHGLVRCSSGNLSWRLGGFFLITASRSWLSEMTADKIAVCRMSDGACINDLKPSVETGFHHAVLRQRLNISFVLHFQTPCATAVACRQGPLPNFDVIPEVPYYIGPIGDVAYAAPGSARLARDVAATMRGHDIVVIRSHGQVVAGASIDDIIQKAEFFELACEILLRGGPQVTPLPADAISSLRSG